MMLGEWRKQALSGHAPPENRDWRGFRLGEGAPFPGFFVGFPVPDVVNPLEGRDNFFVVRDDDNRGFGVIGPCA